jgi:hypothetical protein
MRSLYLLKLLEDTIMSKLVKANREGAWRYSVRADEHTQTHLNDMLTSQDTTFLLDKSEVITLELKGCFVTACDGRELCVFETKLSGRIFTFLYGDFVERYLGRVYDVFEAPWILVERALRPIMYKDWEELVEMTNNWRSKRIIYQTLEMFDLAFTDRGRKELEACASFHSLDHGRVII